MADSDWTIYTVDIEVNDNVSSIKIKFEGKQASNARFLLDEVVVTPKHSITYAVSPAASGSVGGVVYGTSTVVASEAYITEGGKVTLTAEPASGYTFSSWSDGGTNSTLSSTTTNPTTFTMGTSNVTITANFTSSGTVATPYFSPDGGTYNETKSVELSCDTDGATIHYTTNGTPPTSSSPTYSTAISVTTTNTTIKAIAVKDGLSDSEVASATYVIKTKTPTFTVSGGTYTTSQSVELQCETAGATIHYTTDGSTPTASSPTYSSALSVSETTTIKAIAVKANWTNSDVAEAVYSIKVATPTFSPVAGVYSGTQNVTLSCETSEATIKYSTNNGETWNTYSSAIPVSATTTIKAKAEKTGLAESDVATATYTIVTVHDVAWALANIPTNGTDKIKNAYIRGIVSDIKIEYSSTYHNISYNMSDDGQTSSDQLYVFRGKGIGGADLSSVYDIMAEDVVVVNGDLIYYNQTTFEFEAGSGLAYIKPVIKKESVSLTAFNYSHGNGPSASQSFTVRGRNLTENLSVSASSDYEVCATSDGTYTSSLSLSTTNSTTKTIYVRLKSGLSIGDHNGTITMTSSDAVTQTIDLSGSVSGYTVTYDDNGSTSGTVPTDATAYEKSATVTVKTNYGTLAKSGYNFTGWNSKADGTGNHYDATLPLGTFTITANTTIYAEWTPVTYGYTINKTGDDASATAKLQVWNGSAYVDAGDKIACDAQVKVVVTTSQTYYTYTLSSSDVSIDENGVFTMPAKAITITVTTRQLYTITYPGSYTNGSVTTAPESAYAGESVTIVTEPSTNYYLSGITCSDITPTIDGNNITFNMPEKNITISAITFTRIVYTVTYSVNNNTGIIAAENVNAGASTTLPTSVTPPSGFTFAGWTESGDVTVLTGDYEPTSNVTLYAVFDAPVLSEASVFLDGSQLTSTATTGATDKTVYGFEYTFSDGAKQQKVQKDAQQAFSGITSDDYAVLIGKKGKYIKNKTAFGEGITKFEIYANKGASTAVSVGVYFSSSTIDSYVAYNASTNINTWECDLSKNDTVYDASAALYNASSELIGAKYFWYQVTNSNNSQVIFRITYNYYKHSYYTRVITGNTTANANINTGETGPIYIKSGNKLDMSTYTLVNTDPANLVIEDGGQLITASENVAATVKKEIHEAATKDATYWYVISSAVADPSIGDDTNLITVDGEDNPTYDLYRFNEKYNASTPWENYRAGHADFTTLEKGRGYLYRNASTFTVSMEGEVNVADINYPVTITGEGDFAGFNLIGNPYSHNIYKGAGTAIPNGTEFLSTGFYYMDPAEGAWKPGTDNTTPIKPNEGILVKTAKDGDIEMTKTTASASAKYNSDNIMFQVANSKYEDIAYAWFGKGIGLDKINHRNPEVPMLYIRQDGGDYAIATMGDDTKAFSLNFRAMTTGKYTLSYKAKGEFSYLHVIDKFTGEDVDMLLEGEYSFIASPNDSDARFIVKLAYLPDYGEGSDDIFAFQSGSEVFVSGEGELQVFDVLGRFVMSERINGVKTVSVPAQGVYVFRLVGENVKTQKIVVR
ncbi:MAG: chitobiase/beta-hexosaminidase C-terminal domain-containing protein [Bacteroidales bacterium]|nr:chitobiase/beta-hexosaminidase C-terminal domain-containing protein [Bacteroidales bacterium]